MNCTKVIAAVARYYGRSIEDLTVSRHRGYPMVEERQVAMFLCLVLTGASTRQVAKLFDNRTHPTVMHAERKMRRARGHLRRDLDRIVARLNMEAAAEVPHLAPPPVTAGMGA